MRNPPLHRTQYLFDECLAAWLVGYGPKRA